jgi:hypothetical protein
MSLRCSLAALLHVHGTEAVLETLVECASYMVNASEADDFAVAARRAAVEMARAAASSVALEQMPGAIPFARILDPRP